MELRDYQAAASSVAVSKIINAQSSCLIEIPTGGGKSLIIADIVSKLLTINKSVLILTHVKELVIQNARHIFEHAPEIDYGIVSASLKSRQLDKKITIGTVGTVFNVLGKLKHRPTVVIIDEAHLIGRGETGRYQKIINELSAPVIGLTATPFRLDSGLLTSGKGAIFEKIDYKVKIPDLIDRGFLVPPTAKLGGAKINTAGLKKVNGDFAIGELEARALAKSEAAVDDLISRAAGRQRWLIFAVGIEHVAKVTELLLAKGIRAAGVTAVSSDRDQVIRDFRDGRLQAVVNCMVLTTGFDVPAIDLIALLRPTLSAGLYVQMLGRGMRPYQDKKDFLVLDYSGNVMRHGPVDAPEISKNKIGDGDGIAPCKYCPQCLSIILAGFKTCPDCGFVFPESTPVKTSKAYDGSILSTEILVYEVEKMVCDLYRSIYSGKTTVRIRYILKNSNLVDVYEWILVAPRQNSYVSRAIKMGYMIPPITNDQFLANLPPTPRKILVKREGKFFKVVSRVL